MLKFLALWFPMLLIAIANGAARDLWYKKHIGELLGHQISTISLIILFWFYIKFVIIKFPPVSEIESVYIGICWLLLTLTFEFGFGLYRGKTWTELFADYNILKGRLWILIPVWTSIAPYILYKLRSP